MNRPEIGVGTYVEDIKGAVGRVIERDEDDAKVKYSDGSEIWLPLTDVEVAA